MRLFIFGLGYTTSRFVTKFGSRFDAICATVRNPAQHSSIGGVEILRFSNEMHDEALLSSLHSADIVLVSIPPQSFGDPVLGFASSWIGRCNARLIYLSSVGVYGDHGGAWVNENTPLSPATARSQHRLETETAWTRTCGGALAILRLAGIYGPGRNALARLREGSARKIMKDDQIFNRIHVDDAARAIYATIERRFTSVCNVCDDLPAPPQDVVEYAASLLDMSPPPDEPFEHADLSPMARGFFAANARVSNWRMKQCLGVKPIYPSYRDGLRALWAMGEGRS